MFRAPQNSVACGRYCCLVREKRGRRRLRLGKKMIVCWPGWGPRDRTPAMAALVAAWVRSWLEWKPRSMQRPSEKVRKAATKWSGCGTG